jgi:hypothetical protein
MKALMVAFDPRASDFPLRPGFPVLLANTLSWFFPTWLQAQADQAQAGDARVLSTDSAAAITLLKPHGRRVSVASTGLSTSFYDTTETGFYRVEAGGEASEFAVNLESGAETDILQRFSSLGTHPAGSDERKGMPTPVWPVVAAAALALLLLEWLAWAWRPGRTTTA